ncbi:MAG: nicotinate-nucleotide--dimethylbenzimidazole phosphoribosyltransferase [Anaerolineales bacterium]
MSETPAADPSMNVYRMVTDLCAAIEPLDRQAMQAARARQVRLTKPPGSMGRLEDLSIQLAGIMARPIPRIDNKLIVVMAADHGVAEEGVSAYPTEVTAQMVRNYIQGGAAINVLAETVGARVVVVDVGVKSPIKGHPHLVTRSVGPGTGNIAREPAMSAQQAAEAISVGVDVFDSESSRGVDVVAAGEMGIANTTATAAVAAALTGAAPEEVCGRGTGLDDEGLARKIQVVRRALRLHRTDPRDPIDVLVKLGGFEIAGLVGLMLRAAAARVPVVMDGFISCTAGLIALRLCPEISEYLFAAHRSTERGHSLVLKSLGQEPLLDLRLRLGEASGAALGLYLLDAAARLLADMATFEEAGVSGPT